MPPPLSRRALDRRLQAGDKPIPAGALHPRQRLQAGRERGHSAVSERQGQDPGAPLSQVLCRPEPDRRVPRVAAHDPPTNLRHVLPDRLAGAPPHRQDAHGGQDRGHADAHGAQPGRGRGGLAGGQGLPHRQLPHGGRHLCSLRDRTDT